VNFAEHPPSTEWAALKYRGETIAEVWFKPEGEPFALTFRVPPPSIHLPGLDQLLTAENLLGAVGLTAAEVESWRHDGASPAELGHPLPPPAPGVAHLHLYVHLKPSLPAVAPSESGEPEISEEKWQDLEGRWNAIETVETTLECLRLRMVGLQSELEASTRKMLTPDEKVHALNADVAQWNKAKNRVHYVVPKAKEFIHRATWAMGTPERKMLGELFKEHERPHVPLAQMTKVRELLESLLKDRQVLSAQGVTVSQECQTVLAEVQGALRTLQSNAAANARNSREKDRKKGKYF
jgi:hypothetical protein